VRVALISDIHGNIEALDAVMADIAACHIDKVFCLGDIVVYGPNPGECLDRVMQCDLCILGDTDHAVQQPTSQSVSDARELEWTRDQLLLGERSSVERRWEFLRNLAPSASINGFQLVHGSVSGPLADWVFPEDVYNRPKMDRLFGLVETHAFQGHTHLPGVFTQTLEHFTPVQVDCQYRLGNEKTMINVGSVGQPRDGDPRACYVVVEDETVTFHRVAYDFERTIAKLADLP
jgi:predicted phosphodiesterase